MYIGIVSLPQRKAMSKVKLNLFGKCIEYALVLHRLSAAHTAVIISQNAPRGYITMNKLYFKCALNLLQGCLSLNPMLFKKKNGYRTVSPRAKAKKAMVIHGPWAGSKYGIVTKANRLRPINWESSLAIPVLVIPSIAIGKFNH